jgi:hypothetical protein
VNKESLFSLAIIYQYMYAYLANSPEHDQYEGVQAMQASKRIAEEAPSSSRLELLLLNLQVFPLLH